MIKVGKKGKGGKMEKIMDGVGWRGVEKERKKGVRKVGKRKKKGAKTW